MKKLKQYQRRFKILIYLNIFLFMIIFISLFSLQIVRNKDYKEKYLDLSENITEGSTSPRGYIYDRFGRLIVGNKPVRLIYYKKPKNISSKDEIELSYKLANYLDIDYSKITDDIKKVFWIKINSDRAKDKITKQELIDLKYRKISGTDIEKLKKDRITTDELNELNELDLEA